MDEYDELDLWESEYAEELAMLEENGRHDHQENDIISKSYQISDELIKRSLEEERQKLSSKEKENVTPNATIQPPSSFFSQDDSYPVVQFSFMSNTPSQTASTGSPPRTLSIVNSKRKSGIKPDTPDRPSASDEFSVTKRSKKDPDMEKVLTRVPATGDFIRVSDYGKKAYLKVLSRIPEVAYLDNQESLLQTPFQYLKNQVMRDFYDKKSLPKVETEHHHVHAGTPTNKHPGLWVDNYTPSTYVDLLSDDGVNKQVLHWVKLWDGIVFNRKMKERPPPVQQKWQNADDFERFKRNQEPEYDGQGFPFRKTILLAGPPGLGKTTLAHVVARHAGYNVVEMNASDDRSPSQFTEQIENATQMSGVLDRLNRPNCLVIDEIDGAGAPAVQVLVKLLDPLPVSSESSRRAKKGKRLRRPIICICNDPWVPALRELRKIAQIITFPPTQSSRLAYRLKRVCTVEDLAADMTTLLYLCEKTDNDIRNSLNTLQFLKASKEPLSLVRLKEMNVGNKDVQESLFKLWSLIFTQPRKKGASSLRGTTLKHDNERFTEMLRRVHSTGEYDRQADGIHENVLLLRIREAKFHSLVDSLDWFMFSDMLGYEVQKTQNYELYDYQAYLPVAFHFLFALVHPPKIVFPSSSRNCYYRSQTTKDLSELVVSGTVPSSRIHLTPRHLCCDLASYLTRLLCPTFRPVNIQLYSEAEKRAKDNLVSTMNCYDLEFVQYKTVEGMSQYRLEPDILSLARYEGQPDPKELPYSIKQMLSREVALRRIGGVQATPGAPPVPSTSGESEKVVPRKVDFSKEKVPVNYLTKIIKNKEVLLRKKDAYVQKARTFFKFNEGFSNAVRKPVRMSAFL